MINDGFYRVSLVLKNKKQYDDWIEFKNKKGYSNFSQMVRAIVEKERLEDIDAFKKELQPIKDSLQGLYKINQFNYELSEIILMKLSTEDNRSGVIKAANEILSVLKTKRTSVEIYGTLNYHENVIRNALSLLCDLNIIDVKMIDPKNKEKEI